MNGRPVFRRVDDRGHRGDHDYAGGLRERLQEQRSKQESKRYRVLPKVRAAMRSLRAKARQAQQPRTGLRLPQVLKREA
jgi:hypothetical protein